MSHSRSQFGIDFRQSLANDFTMIGSFSGEIAEQTAIFRIMVSNGSDGRVKKGPQPLERGESVVLQGVAHHHATIREIKFKDLERESLLGIKVIGEGPLRHPRGLNDVAYAGTNVPALKHHPAAVSQ